MFIENVYIRPISLCKEIIKTNHLSFVIGRFQPFHKGHKQLIDTALSLNKTGLVIVFVGSSSESNTYKNPFNFLQRVEIISSCYTKEELKRLVFVPLLDYKKNSLWLKEINEELISYDIGQTEFKKYYFVCCDKDEETLNNNSLLFKIKGVHLVPILSVALYNATDIRKQLKSNTPLVDIKGLNKESLNTIKKYLKEIPCLKS